MPFTQQVPHNFTHESVEVLRPNQFGVYGIFREGVWIYVGKGNIRERLLAHLNGDRPAILQARPTHWVGEIVIGDPSARERQLILELNPICNERTG